MIFDQNFAKQAKTAFFHGPMTRKVTDRRGFDQQPLFARQAAPAKLHPSFPNIVFPPHVSLHFFLLLAWQWRHFCDLFCGQWKPMLLGCFGALEMSWLFLSNLESLSVLRCRNTIGKHIEFLFLGLLLLIFFFFLIEQISFSSPWAFSREHEARFSLVKPPGSQGQGLQGCSFSLPVLWAGTFLSRKKKKKKNTTCRDLSRKEKKKNTTCRDRCAPCMPCRDLSRKEKKKNTTCRDRCAPACVKAAAVTL